MTATPKHQEQPNLSPSQQSDVVTTITLPGGIPCTILRGHDPELARRQREFMNDLVRATGGQK